jgi:hypothetical protein
MLILFACRQMMVGELDFNTFHLLTNGGSGLAIIYRHMQSASAVEVPAARRLSINPARCRCAPPEGAPDSAAAEVIEAREWAL